MVSTRNMARNGHNNNANKGPNPIAMISKLQKDLAKLRKHSTEDSKAIRALKYGTNQHTIGTVNTSTMLLCTRRHPFID